MGRRIPNGDLLVLNDRFQCLLQHEARRVGLGHEHVEIASSNSSSSTGCCEVVEGSPDRLGRGQAQPDQFVVQTALVDSLFQAHQVLSAAPQDGSQHEERNGRGLQKVISDAKRREAHQPIYLFVIHGGDDLKVPMEHHRSIEGCRFPRQLMTASMASAISCGAES